MRRNISVRGWAEAGADNGRHGRGGSLSPQQRIFLEVLLRHGSDVKSRIGWVLGGEHTACEVSSRIKEVWLCTSLLGFNTTRRSWERLMNYDISTLCQTLSTALYFSLVLHKPLVINLQGSCLGHFNKYTMINEHKMLYESGDRNIKANGEGFFFLWAATRLWTIAF